MDNIHSSDLLSIQEARDLTERASSASQKLRSLTQEQADGIAENMAKAGFNSAERLAKMAVEETGFGKWEDKKIKNEFATKALWESIREMKTVGFLDPEGSVRRVAEPMGVVAGIIPSTNPTSTVLYKAIISLKSRNSVVFSPHPAAVKCIMEASRLMAQSAMEAGAPEDAVLCMTIPELSGTHELMSHPKIGVILATGGSGLVKSAYSSGKPAYGVGPGNVPAFIERSAEAEKAVKDITLSKCFDNGTVCASEQAIIVDRSLEEKVRALLRETGSHFCSTEEIAKLEKLMILPRGLNPRIVGQSAFTIASWAGFSLPENTKMLIVDIGGVGKDYPLSVEKLSPVISFYVVDGWEAGCELCIKIINYGGIGHTMALHTNDRKVVEAFALEKPVMRVLVNTPATHGAIGYTTDLAPAMTLGCGTWGGSITADNVTPLHLLNIKRLAFETKSLHTGKAKSSLGETTKVRWRYDEQYHYGPESERFIKSDSKEDAVYGEGITERQVSEIIRKFKVNR
jgi:acetaldehyde dehydrogenase (acetylating)